MVDGNVFFPTFQYCGFPQDFPLYLLVNELPFGELGASVLSAYTPFSGNFLDLIFVCTKLVVNFNRFDFRREHAFGPFKSC